MYLQAQKSQKKNQSIFCHYCNFLVSDSWEVADILMILAFDVWMQRLLLNCCSQRKSQKLSLPCLNTNTSMQRVGNTPRFEFRPQTPTHCVPIASPWEPIFSLFCEKTQKMVSNLTFAFQLKFWGEKNAYRRIFAFKEDSEPYNMKTDFVYVFGQQTVENLVGMLNGE